MLKGVAVADRDHLFQRLCHEAVLACGSDRVAIERFVNNRIEATDGVDRAAIKRDCDRVIEFQAPIASAQTH